MPARGDDRREEPLRGPGLQVYLEVLGAALPPLALGEVQAAEQVEHTVILAHHERVQAPYAPLACGLDEVAGEPDAEPPALKTVLDHRGVLGGVGLPLALVADDAHDLLGVLGVERHQGGPAPAARPPHAP